MFGQQPFTGGQPVPVRVQLGEHHGGGDFGFLVLALLLQALFVGLALLLTLLVARRVFGGRKPWRAGGAMPMPMPRSPALDELELRYARGDIAREDYLVRRDDLAASAQRWAPPMPYGPPPFAGPPPQAGPPPPAGRPTPGAPPPPSSPAATYEPAAGPPAEPPPEPPAV